MSYKRTIKTLRGERPLTEHDHRYHLSIANAVGRPHASDRVIRMNSVYLEMVDGSYVDRGAVSAWGVFAVSSVSLFLFSFWKIVIFDNLLNPNWSHRETAAMLSAAFVLSIVGLVVLYGAIWFSRHTGEWFRYTHYPIRFNRRNRMVYVFRGDGTVLEASWDNIHFTLHEVKKVGTIAWLGISGLVLKDPRTVQEQFTFGYSAIREGNCKRHWEFIRRYMQDGPQAVTRADGFTYCLPIADKKETPYQGWVELLSNDAPGSITRWLMLPINVLFFIGRMVANATCKVPLWPADVEAACRVDANDPYMRDSRSNPEGYR